MKIVDVSQVSLADVLTTHKTVSKRRFITVNTPIHVFLNSLDLKYNSSLISQNTGPVLGASRLTCHTGSILDNSLLVTRFGVTPNLLLDLGF